MQLPNRPTGTAGGGGGRGLQALPELSSDREESKTNNTGKTGNSTAAAGGGKLPEFPLYFSERDFRGDVRIGRQYGKLIIMSS